MAGRYSAGIGRGRSQTPLYFGAVRRVTRTAASGPAIAQREWCCERSAAHRGCTATCRSRTQLDGCQTPRPPAQLVVGASDGGVRSSLRLRLVGSSALAGRTTARRSGWLRRLVAAPPQQTPIPVAIQPPWSSAPKKTDQPAIVPPDAMSVLAVQGLFTGVQRRRPFEPN